jgi:hypothetical protein
MTRHRAEQMPVGRLAEYLDKAVAEGWTIHTITGRDGGWALVVTTREE